MWLFYFHKNLTKFNLVHSSVKKNPNVASHDNSFSWCRYFPRRQKDIHEEDYSRFLQFFSNVLQVGFVSFTAFTCNILNGIYKAKIRSRPCVFAFCT